MPPDSPLKIRSWTKNRAMRIKIKSYTLGQTPLGQLTEGILPEKKTPSPPSGQTIPNTPPPPDKNNYTSSIRGCGHFLE